MREVYCDDVAMSSSITLGTEKRCPGRFRQLAKHPNSLNGSLLA
jgi:hypothetical protein